MDRTGTKCQKCDGTYGETSVYDDWAGVLHCGKCGHEVPRYCMRSIMTEYMKRFVKTKFTEVK